MVITKKYLSRRTALRGLGATIALPLLDSMVPAFAAVRSSAARPIKRLGAVYVPNGMSMPNWTPAATLAAWSSRRSSRRWRPCRTGCWSSAAPPIRKPSSG